MLADTGHLNVIDSTLSVTLIFYFYIRVRALTLLWAVWAPDHIRYQHSLTRSVGQDRASVAASAWLGLNASLVRAIETSFGGSKTIDILNDFIRHIIEKDIAIAFTFDY